MWHYLVVNVWPNVLANIFWAPLAFLGTHVIVKHHIGKTRKRK